MYMIGDNNIEYDEIIEKEIKLQQPLSSYINIIEKKIYDKLNINEKLNSVSKQKKIVSNDSLIIPSYDNLNILFDYNYGVPQLKIFLKYYKLKISGAKKELLLRIYNFVYLSKYAIKIQKVFRGFLLRQYNYLKGPAFLKRNICNNNNDFLSFEDLNNIDYSQFFSYKDIDNFVYGFDILSIYNLIFVKKGNNIITNSDVKNPYNRNDIPYHVILDIKKILKLSKIFKINVCTRIKDINDDVTFQKTLEFKAIEIFQYINSLGNYSDVNWFLNLDKNKLILFIRELEDIWNYRAQILPHIKRAICPPYGNPFTTINVAHIDSSSTIHEIRKNILNIIEKFVFSGIDRENKKLGSLYILSALTLVNENAATTLTWLFESVSNNFL